MPFQVTLQFLQCRQVFNIAEPAYSSCSRPISSTPAGSAPGGPRASLDIRVHDRIRDAEERTMIDGLKLTFTGEELRKLLEERMADHGRCAERWRREQSRTKENETEMIRIDRT
jgi:hypothetical protein